MRRWVGIVAVLALLVAACTGSDGDEAATPTTEPSVHGGAPVTAWFELATDMARSQRLSPPVASRVYVYLAVSVHGAATGGADLPLNDHPGLPEPPAGYDPEAGMAGAATAWLDQIFPRGLENERIVEARQAAMDDAVERVGPDAAEASAAYGAEVVATLEPWIAADGYAEAGEAEMTYVHEVVPGGWTRTPPGLDKPLEPFWGDLRTFVADRAACPLREPVPYSEEPGSPFWQEAEAVRVVNATLTEEEGQIARFWDDLPGFTSTPPGHWISIIAQVSEQEAWDVETTADAYLTATVSMADAFIVGWDGKYTTNVIRPITYIREHMEPDWSAYLVTPPFPEYPSGHSIASATTAVALDGVVGAFPYEDATNLAFAEIDEPRRYGSFPDAAIEADLSRLYGGIHYPMGVSAGANQGACLGDQIADVLGPALGTSPEALGNEPEGWHHPDPVITAQQIIAERGDQEDT